MNTDNTINATDTAEALDDAVPVEKSAAPRRVLPALPRLPALPALPALRLDWLARRGVEPLLVTLLFIALTVLMTWPWTLHVGEAINPFGDVVVQMTSLRWNAHALTTNPAGLFEAPFFYPYSHSLAFSENLIGETLFTLPILLLTGNPALAANLYILLTFVLTGLFTYLLVRDLTGSRPAAILAAVAFAFCPFRFMQMGHLHMLSTQWFPFTLWALRRGLGVLDYGRWTSRYGKVQQRSLVVHPRGGFWLILAALGFVAMGLSSIYYIYFLALALVLYIAWWLFSEVLPGTRVTAVSWGPVIVGGVIGLLVIGLALGPVLWPYLQTNSELGFSRSTYEVQNWSANWSYFRNVLQSNWLYAHLIAPSWASAAGERELFPGIVPTLLALVGLVWGRGRGRFYYLILGLFALALTFGLSHNLPGTSREVPLPYAFFYDWVPGFKALRVPVRFAVLVDFSLYVLAGYGLARILSIGLRKPKTASTDEITNSSLGSIVLNTQQLETIEPEAVRARRWPLVVAGLLTLLVLLEFINPLDTSNRRDVTAQLAGIEPYGWLAQPENAGPVLELPMSADQNDVWYTFFATKHWQPLVNGWSSFVPPGTVHLARALEAFPDPQTMTLLQGLEVRHIVVHLWQYPDDRQAALKERLDSTPELKLVKEAGNNYVYELAQNGWLRDIADRLIKSKGTIWIGEARRNSMPALEVAAYALMKWGVPPGNVGGNIDIGYRPIGQLPFGTAPDYVLAPNLPGLDDTPFGYEYMQEQVKNAAVRFLQSPPVVLRTYDMSRPAAPQVDLKDLRLGVGPGSVNFSAPAPKGAAQEKVYLSMTFLAFAPSEIAVRVGSGKAVSLALPVGVSRLATRTFNAPGDVVLQERAGDATLLKVDLVKSSAEPGGGPDALLLPPNPPLPVPIKVEAARGTGTLDANMRIVSPNAGEELAATVDVYVEPWGTHPEGHFGYWSVVIPADGAAHDYTFRLDPLTKNLVATQDGQLTQVFGWQGPPTRGDFRATLYITRKGAPIAGLPLYLFTLDGGHLTDVKLAENALSVVRP